MKQIELTIGKRKLNFKLGIGFLGEVLDKTGYDIETVDTLLNTNPFKIVPILMYHSAVYSLEIVGKTADFTQLDFIDWLDDDGGINNPSALKFLNAFSQSLTKDVPVEKNTGNGSVKKKLIGKKM